MIKCKINNESVTLVFILKEKLVKGDRLKRSIKLIAEQLGSFNWASFNWASFNWNKQ